jgi:hypothetical protein
MYISHKRLGKQKGGRWRRGENVRAAGLSHRVFGTPLSNALQGGRAGWSTQEVPDIAISVLISLSYPLEGKGTKDYKILKLSVGFIWQGRTKTTEIRLGWGRNSSYISSGLGQPNPVQGLG